MFDLLKGVRVLEFGVLYNGDTAGMLMADLGADVVKIESPGRGDYLRHFLGQITPGNSPSHVQINRNKRSLTLDLRTPQGRAVLFRLLETTDIVVDGFVGKTLEKLGCGYDAMRKAKRDIVYVQVTGFGASAPYGDVPTHGQNMNAIVGAMPVAMGEDGLVRQTGDDGVMGGLRQGGEGTFNAGLFAAFYASAALQRRAATGQGAYIDIAGSDATIAAAWVSSVYSLNDSRITDRTSIPDMGSDPAQNTTAKYQFYQTRDRRYLLFCAVEHKYFQRFAETVGRPDLLDETGDNAFVDFGDGEEALRRKLQDIFHTRTLAEWMAYAAETLMPMGPANHWSELQDDPQISSRNILVEGIHPDAGPFTYVGSPAMIDGLTFEIGLPAPSLGQDGDRVLRERGFSSAEIAALRSAGTV